MSPNKGETAVYGCYCPGDIVVRMRKVLAIPRSWYVCLIAVTCAVLVPRERAHRTSRALLGTKGLFRYTLVFL